jgi:hypothetical protein
MYIGLHVKYPLFLSDFNESRNFTTGLGQYVSNFMKIRPVGADERTDRHNEASSRLSQFSENASKIADFV